MLNTLDIGEGVGRHRASLNLQDVSGIGRLNPRLQLSFTAHPVPHATVVLSDVTLRLEHRQELIGEGRVAGQRLYDGSAVTFEVVTSQRLLRHITDGLAPEILDVQLDARLRGVGHFSVDPTALTSPGPLRIANDPEPGQSKDFELSAGMPSTLQIARGAWYGRVLAPTRNEQYRYLEVALPRDDEELGAEWANAVAHLDGAEQAHASGDDATVFLRLRGAIDSLPGAKQQILAGISDTDKRADLDALLKQAGKFLHDGRHVAADGVQAGTFPVDHLDAAFALDLMRVLLSHLSLMLSAERERKRN